MGSPATLLSRALQGPTRSRPWSQVAGPTGRIVLIIERPTERSEECRVVSGRPDPSFPGFLLSWGARSTPRRGRPAGLLRVGRAQAAGAAFCREALTCPAEPRPHLGCPAALHGCDRPRAPAVWACGPSRLGGGSLLTGRCPFAFLKSWSPKVTLPRTKGTKSSAVGRGLPAAALLGPGGVSPQGQLSLSLDAGLVQTVCSLCPELGRLFRDGQVAPHAHTAPGSSVGCPLVLSPALKIPSSRGASLRSGSAAHVGSKAAHLCIGS